MMKGVVIGSLFHVYEVVRTTPPTSHGGVLVRAPYVRGHLYAPRIAAVSTVVQADSNWLHLNTALV